MRNFLSGLFITSVLCFCLNVQAQSQKDSPVMIEVTKVAYELFSGSNNDGSIASIQLFQNARQRGVVKFFPAGKSLTKSSYDAKTGFMTLNYSIELFDVVKDLLETEGKNLQMKYDAKTGLASIVASDASRTPTDPRTGRANNSAVKNNNSPNKTNINKIQNTDGKVKTFKTRGN